YNIAHQLPFPLALDLRQSPTWISPKNSGYYGKRKIEQFIHRQEFELYDLENDPDELINLAGNMTYAEVLEEMKEKLKDFQKRTVDPWIYKWELE
ncbi:MAG: DUF4976 domain-containing protein, partial [Mariniphaga sp.]|nr:DUF4976 domain-containing protein [Mariniphaga sp.]